MKWTFLVIILIIIAIPLLMSFTSIRIEKQKYRVVKQEKEFEIRYYPPAILATIRSSASSYRELGSSGFRKIAGYIFGKNEAAAKIAMTAPVHMDINDKESSMSFVMPAAYTLDQLPKPADTQVELEKAPATYMAAIAFSGYANDQKINFYTARLLALLKQKGIKTSGHPKYLGYNAPYEIIGRKNEVVIAVEWTE